MDTLNVVVRKYLNANGIRVGYFADYIGCDRTRCSRWLKGESRLRKIQIKKIHEFLEGKFLKSVEDIMKKGENVIIRINFNDELYDFLIQVLNEKFYATTDLEELAKINQLYKSLGHKTESWLSAIQPNISPK